MSRKTITRKKKVQTLEPKHHNPLLSKFMRMLMWSGKLSKAMNNVYGALDKLEDKVKKPGLEVFIAALENVKPLVRVKARRVGGSTYQVPIEVPEDAGFTLAMRWIIDSARKKTGSGIDERLYDELFAAYEKRGDAFKKKEDTHRMADANRAYAHYRV